PPFAKQVVHAQQDDGLVLRIKNSSNHSYYYSLEMNGDVVEEFRNIKVEPKSQLYIGTVFFDSSDDEIWKIIINKDERRYERTYNILHFSRSHARQRNACLDAPRPAKKK
ncbi:hypothetical protein THIOM_003537, partial [Candidatus Thiomargarita nelsonii]